MMHRKMILAYLKQQRSVFEAVTLVLVNDSKCHLQKQKLQGNNKCYRRIEDWFKTMQQSSTSFQNFQTSYLNLS